ncbi:MAG: hypothetical protein IIC50_09425 [Planctomycetes bacterium]|nr:hypothetical protein [Planctomycetota bacterium]
MTTRLHGQTVVQAWSKAGVMVGGSLASESGNGFVANTGINGVRFQVRPTSFVASVKDDPAPDAVQQTIPRDTPVWLRVERVGDDLNGYYALDQAGIRLGGDGLESSDHPHGSECLRWPGPFVSSTTGLTTT